RWYYSSPGGYDSVGPTGGGTSTANVTIGGSGPVTISQIATLVTYSSGYAAFKLALYDGGTGTTLLDNGGSSQTWGGWVTVPVNYQATGGTEYKVAFVADRQGTQAALKTGTARGHYNWDSYGSFPLNPASSWAGQTNGLFAVAVCVGTCTDQPDPPTPPPATGVWYYSAGGPGGYNGVDWAGTYSSDVTIGGSGPVDISQIAVKVDNGNGCPWKLALYNEGSGTTLLADGGAYIGGSTLGAQWLANYVDYQATGGSTYKVAYSPGCMGAKVAVNTNTPGGYYNFDSYGSFPLNSSGVWNLSTETLAVAICAGGTCLTGP
ncbi:MAG: hypothetical protein LBQ00_08200, partial [Syntrophobacterales bacterium]|nr:hypothetical protein [Syntrophobacterales bacterium]